MKRSLLPDHVFADGLSLQDVRDAITAAGTIHMWETAYDIAKRYRIQDVICLKCGCDTTPQTHTYYVMLGVAVRLCLRCSDSLGRRR